MTQVQLLRFVADWISNLPFTLLGLLVLVNAKKIVLPFSLRIWQLLLAIYTVLFVSLFFPYFFTGVLGQHRTLNFAYWFFIPLCVLLLKEISEKQELHVRLQFLQTPKVSFVLIAVSLLLMAITKNGYNLAYDFSKGNLQAYKTELLQRELLAQGHLSDTAFHLPSIKNRPASIFLYDETDPKIWWQEKCVMEYYRARRQPPKPQRGALYNSKL